MHTVPIVEAPTVVVEVSLVRAADGAGIAPVADQGRASTFGCGVSDASAVLFPSARTPATNDELCRC